MKDQLIQLKSNAMFHLNNAGIDFPTIPLAINAGNKKKEQKHLLKNDNGTIRVWSDGCYDMLHFGHANQMRQAKAMGTLLVVGVHSDLDIRVHKGQPVFREEERYALARAIRWVDEVVGASPYLPTIENTLDKYGCQFCVHGDDISLASDGSDTLGSLKSAGRYRECPRTVGVSTTALLRRILMRRECSDLENGNDKMTVVPPATKIVCSPWSFTDMNNNNSIDNNTNADWSSMPADYVEYFCDRIFTYNSTQKEISPSKLRSTLLPSNKAGTASVVYVSGHFDLFHIGHLRFLEEAAKLGDLLLVGLLADNNNDDDEDVEEKKNADTCKKFLRVEMPPTIMNAHQRALTVLAYRMVSAVIIDVPRCTTKELIQCYGVDVVAVGQKKRDTCNAVPQEMGILRVIHSGSDVTTDEIINRILDNAVDYEVRNAKKDFSEMAAYKAMQRNY